jgi:glycosyltransferase involved in cell wall biosynthesis
MVDMNLHEKVSAMVYTLDSERTLEKTLQSLTWVDELIVVDMGSTDLTLEIAARYAANIRMIPKAPRIDGVRNAALDFASHPWVLVVDSDEYLAEDAGEVLREYIHKYGARYDAFALPRFNTIAGQIMRGSLWYPDHQIRLFKKGTVQWSDTTHRLPVVTTGSHRLHYLKPPHCPHLHHRNYENLRHFIRKQLDYALTDNFDSDPEGFDFSAYVARAYENLAVRCDPDRDGDLSHALSLIMAWDEIVRGLIHWDLLERGPILGYLKALPVASCKVPWWRIRIRRWLFRHYPFEYVAKRLKDMLKGWLWVMRGGKQ